MFDWLKRPASDPTTIGHYAIDRKLGSGGMGVVYAARDQRLGRRVAIKMIQAASRDPHARKRLWREARSAAGVNHPNICQVHEMGERAGEPYIVMELLEGESLAERLVRQRLPLEEAVRITLELLEGLGALHRSQLLHRDLKPSNVFLTPHGVKLLDFGLVRAAWSDDVTPPIASASALTAAGAIVGTPRYMAPEQVYGRPLDARADLFAVGAILYEMVAGRPAFDGSTAIEVLHAILHEQPAALDGPPEVQAAHGVAMRAMAKRPEERMASAQAMADELRRALASPASTVEAQARRPDPTARGKLEAARLALSRRSWKEAFDLLAAVDSSGEDLGGDDLAGLGEAAVWSHQAQVSIDARQRAYAAYVRTAQPRRAAAVALALVINHYTRLDYAVAAGWLSKARRLLEGEPEGVEHGYLAATEAVFLIGKGELEAGARRAAPARESGRRHADADLQAIALALEGFALVRLGRTTEGMPLLDEAMASALGGELGPLATGVAYCRTICACIDLFDFRRALEWTHAVERCVAGSGPGGFPGDCRVHHATLLRLKGAWEQGEDEARRAGAEAEGYDLHHSGFASYEIGEIRLRAGDLAAAHEAFRRAHELGMPPQPGLSLLRLREGRLPEASASITDAVAEAGGDRLRRARLLPAQVEIALASGERAAARLAASELEGIAADFGTTALLAAAEDAMGALALAEGNVGEAVARLRNASRLWLENQAPYEAARARLKLAEALQTRGNAADAALEAQAALAQFERLGARRDAERASRLVAELGPS